MVCTSGCCSGRFLKELLFQGNNLIEFVFIVPNSGAFSCRICTKKYGTPFQIVSMLQFFVSVSIQILEEK
jgi:hypothetical protein